MYEVTLNVLSKKTNKHLSFKCDSFERYEFEFKFTFGQIGCMWSHNYCYKLVKSITKL